MINSEQLRLVVDLLGSEQTLAQLSDALSSLEHLIAEIDQTESLNSVGLEQLHKDLNSVTALGANRLASRIARLETQLREERPVDHETTRMAKCLVEQTKAAFEETLVNCTRSEQSLTSFRPL